MTVVLDLLHRAQHRGPIVLRRFGELGLGDRQLRLAKASVEQRKVDRRPDAPEQVDRLEQPETGVLRSPQSKDRELREVVGAGRANLFAGL